jgi:chromate transporter
MRERTRELFRLAGLFLKLGTLGFGGPAAHIALMEDEVVRRRSWLTHEEFLDLVAAAHLIPGPNSTELAIHIGLRRAGVLGLIVAGTCFILPAALIVTAIAWAYVTYGSLPAAARVLFGVKAVVVAVIVQALWRLGRSAITSRASAVLALAALAAGLAGIDEIGVILGCGVAAGAIRAARDARDGAPAGALMPIFLFFLKVGSVLFGSGYVLVVFLRADLVERWRLITEGQLLDAVAVGQITPGPVFTTATFIGYLLAGGRGAAVATVGIFLPAFVFVAASAPLLPRMRRSRSAAAFLDGVVAASLALMAIVTVELARGALIDLTSAALFAAAAVTLLATRINATWLILAGALVSALLHR